MRSDCCCFCRSEAGAYLYNVTDLGTLGGSASYGLAVNNNGQVTGATEIDANGLRHAFLYSGGVMLDIDGSAGESVGKDINDSGEVTGWSGNRGFVYSGGAVTLLPGLPPWPEDRTEGRSITTAAKSRGTLPSGTTTPHRGMHFFTGTASRRICIRWAGTRMTAVLATGSTTVARLRARTNFWVRGTRFSTVKERRSI